jgi:two-component system, cell cycle sensor histidine kinase and response regulator CckA
MPRFDQVLVFCVMSVLVGLFAWIYLRNRERKSGLWLLGWIAILIHYATPFTTWIPGWPPVVALWVNRATLVVAGTFFLFSVSSYRSRHGRTPWFIAAILFSALGYLTLLLLHFRQPWVYLPLLLTGLSIGIVRAFYKNGPGSRFAWFLTVALVPYSIWAAIQVLHGKPARGLDVFLYGVFAVTGALYYRHFRRLTPGVVLSSISFLAWGAVFPVASFLAGRQIFLNGIVWDLPKYFVAFGMVVTLFENQAEVALEVADKFRALFEDNLAAVYVSSLDGKLLDCNGAFVRMYGFASKQESLAGLNSLSFCDGDERESFIRRLRQEGQVVNHECRHRRKDGTPFWILERATIVKAGNGERLVEGTAIEITERKQAEMALKQSEERFSKIFRQGPVGCCIVSLDGRFLDINDNLLNMLGREANQVIGRTALSLGLWKSQSQRDKFYQELRKKGSLRNLSVDFDDASGNRREGNYFATLVRVGEKECIFGMLVDQTEQKELEAKFLQAQKMEALGRLAGGIAHDFNNLLGVIGGYAELLETKLESHESLRHYCSKILDTTQRAGGLTRQLLTFSRKEVTRPMPLRPDQAIRDLAGILPRMLGEDIELSLDLRSTGVVVMDQTHFEQIIINVVINSRDAMPTGGQMFIETEDVFRPVVNVEGGLEGHQFVALYLRDTGCGMTDEIRAHAFEPFYTTKELGRGTGLGLATVYGVVQQSKGELRLESNPGQGTKISILLPANDAAEISDHDGHSTEVMAGSGNILLVEDEADLRDSNAEFLTSIGYSVRCASSGPEALAMVNDHDKIDLVISDVIMPKMNGREFADRLLNARPMTKMLFVSGYANDVLSKTGFSAAATPFLQKPYSLRELGVKVRELLHSETRFTAGAD